MSPRWGHNRGAVCCKIVLTSSQHVCLFSRLFVCSCWPSLIVNWTSVFKWRTRRQKFSLLKQQQQRATLTDLPIVGIGRLVYVVESLNCSYHCELVGIESWGHNHFPKIQSDIEAPAVWLGDGRNTDCLFRKPLHQMNVAGFYALIHAGDKKQQLKKNRTTKQKWIFSIFLNLFFIYTWKSFLNVQHFHLLE